MWLKKLLPGSLTNSDASNNAKLIALLEENNQLLRLQLQQNGVRLPASGSGRPTVPARKRTERDVTVVTRESLLLQQYRNKHPSPEITKTNPTTSEVSYPAVLRSPSTTSNDD